VQVYRIMVARHVRNCTVLVDFAVCRVASKPRRCCSPPWVQGVNGAAWLPPGHGPCDAQCCKTSSFVLVYLRMHEVVIWALKLSCQHGTD
jgi:hypothetical protein